MHSRLVTLEKIVVERFSKYLDTTDVSDGYCIHPPVPHQAAAAVPTPAGRRRIINFNKHISVITVITPPVHQFIIDVVHFDDDHGSIKFCVRGERQELVLCARTSILPCPFPK